MSRYLTYEQLRNPSNFYEQRHDLQQVLKHNYSETITVFLSHRHTENAELLNQVRGFFASLGAKLYIDWMDKDMPEVTSGETAAKLKVRIKASKKFIVLATPDSIQSIWIPWEIGLADQIKGLSHIAILPIIHDDGTWKNREYYQLYNRIENLNGTWSVIQPGFYSTGTPLEKWLKE